MIKRIQEIKEALDANLPLSALALTLTFIEDDSDLFDGN